MTSFIIVGRDKQKRIAYARDFCAKQHIDQFDIALIEKETSVKQNVQSIGIDEVKRIQKTIFLKPFKGNLKAVIIEDAHLLTTEAQNALLKVLEEPPEHTLLLLGADSQEDLLPTIRSRCRIIALEDTQIKLTEKQKQDLTEFIEALPAMPVGDRLKKAESLAKDKDKATEWVERIIIVMRERLVEKAEENLRQTTMTSGLRKLQALHTLLKTTNVNPRFAIEQTLLNI